ASTSERGIRTPALGAAFRSASGGQDGADHVVGGEFTPDGNGDAENQDPTSQNASSLLATGHKLKGSRNGELGPSAESNATAPPAALNGQESGISSNATRAATAPAASDDDGGPEAATAATAGAAVSPELESLKQRQRDANAAAAEAEEGEALLQKCIDGPDVLRGYEVSPLGVAIRRRTDLRRLLVEGESDMRWRFQQFEAAEAATARMVCEERRAVEDAAAAAAKGRERIRVISERHENAMARHRAAEAELQDVNTREALQEAERRQQEEEEAASAAQAAAAAEAATAAEAAEAAVGAARVAAKRLAAAAAQRASEIDKDEEELRALTRG
ncbi:unnamed protein product, partial [Phaeothamnion confervicola]